MAEEDVLARELACAVSGKRRMSCHVYSIQADQLHRYVLTFSINL